ncbi:MAG TPA: ChaN family lipoprotein [Polyangiaceae bacterium]|nr:ChaN family lipoprotein [Polyangiaceae bacterium]
MSRPSLGCVLASLLLATGCQPRPAGAPAAPVAPAPAFHWQSQLGVDHPLAGVLWDVAASHATDEATLAARLAAYDLVLVGETHDNPDHHAIEARIVRAFATAHPAPAVVFEMLDETRQSTVDGATAAHPGDADALAQAVNWDASGWPAWSMYRPVFEAALAARGPILAAGIDRGPAMRIGHEGLAAIDPRLVKTFALDAPLPPDVAAATRHEMGEVHCGMVPDEALDPMVLVQRARDARMAERLHEGFERRGAALLVAGAGHVRRDRGVPVLLQRAYAKSAIAIGLVQVTSEATTPAAYAAGFDTGALPFDFVWFTPRANDVDHCAEMRRK